MGERLRLFGRALQLRCPRCGGRRLFRSYFSVRPACPDCGFETERGDGYWLGSMTLNLVVAELLFYGGLVAAVFLTWPAVPWQAVWIGSVAGTILAPVLFYPFSKTLWFALDLAVQGVSPEEPGLPGERPPRSPRSSGAAAGRASAPGGR